MKAVVWRDRVLFDGVDRAAWERGRWGVIGASDVKTFARRESVPLYFRGKIAARRFHGNAHTARGHEWEPELIAATGVSPSSALVHAPDEVGFAATPDGIDPDGLRLAEAKVRHNRIAGGPTRQELRQLAWQFHCLPEAETVRFVEGELVASQLGWRLRREPRVIEIARDDPRITSAIGEVLPIAREVLALVRTHLELEEAFA